METLQPLEGTNRSPWQGAPTWVASVAVVLVSLVLAAPAAAAPVLRPGFELETVASGLNLPVGIAWAPDGRMFIVEKDGVLKVRKPDGTVQVVLDMRDQVNSYSDRGLLGVAVDRDFANNGEIYLYYTVEVPGVWPDDHDRTISRLDRIAVDANSAVTSPRTTIVGTYQPPPDAFYCPRPHTNDVDCIPADQYWHTVGTVRVDPGDGTLWLGSGDALPPAEGVPDPIAFRTFDEATYAGKIIHVDRNGRGVAGHPFCPTQADTTKVCTKLYAKGFRQPFRFTLRDTTPSAVPRTPERGPVVGDVGWALREEIDLVRPGRNYGWPCYEGRTKPSPYHEAAVCADLYAAEGTASGVTEPALHYHQRDAGGSVTGGAILQGSAYPGTWSGRVYFADYSNRWIRSAPVDASSDSISDADDFRPADFVTDAGGVVDLQVGPDGNLTYVDINTGTVRRIVHTVGNRAPVADGSATPDNGIAPLDVEFSSAGSSDPDGDPLAYHWNFGDGEPPSTTANPTHTYDELGDYTATLTVSDGDRTATKSFAITSANTRPDASISAPSTYRGGVGVPLTATASDPEDGEITDDHRFSWQVVLVHHTHEHFIATLTGRSVQFTPLADHDLDSHYEIRLRVTDAGGLTDEVVKRLDPEAVQLSLSSVPAGAPFNYGETSAELPYAGPTAIGFSTTLSAAPTFVKDGVTYAFESWSNGKPRTQSFTVPVTDTAVVATYNGLPKAAFTAAPADGPAPHDVSFDPSGSNDPDGDTLAYEWDFGDGSPPSRAERPSHRYTVPGLRTVRLTVDDGRGGTASVAQVVAIHEPAPIIVAPDISGLPEDSQALTSPTLAGTTKAAVQLAIPPSGVRVARGGALQVPLVNAGGQEAYGSLTITTADRIAPSRASRKRLALAKRAFTIPPGGTRRVRIQLSRSERALLERKRRLPIMIAIKAGVRGGRVKTVTRAPATLLAPRRAARKQ